MYWVVCVLTSLVHYCSVQTDPGFELQHHEVFSFFLFFIHVGMFSKCTLRLHGMQ